VAAIDATLPGAAWQRCRTHFMRNPLCRVPKSAQPFVASLVRTIFAQPSAAEVAAQLERVVHQLEGRFPEVAALLESAAPDSTAFAAFPPAHWRQIWSNNPEERLNRAIRRRTDVVGIFPDRGAIVRLVGMVLAEQHDEWTVARRYMSAESLAATASRPAELEPADDEDEDNDRDAVRPMLEAAVAETTSAEEEQAPSYTTLTDVARELSGNLPGYPSLIEQLQAFLLHARRFDRPSGATLDRRPGSN